MTQREWAMLGHMLEHENADKFREVGELVRQIVDAQQTIRTAHIRTNPMRPGEVAPLSDLKVPEPG